MDYSHTIQKYPYNGKAKNLIDKFMIIGYEPVLMRKILPEIINKKAHKQKTSYYSPETNTQNFLTEIQLNEPIEVLSEIIYDPSKTLLPNNYIINSIFPSKPISYTEIQCNTSALQANVIFCGDSIKSEDDTKNSFNCYAYVFYEKFKYDNTNFCYLPKALLFISEYPFFTSFNRIATQIEKLLSLSLDVPIEILLYNLVKFTPSPIQYGFTLNLLNQDIPIENLPIFEKLTGYPLYQFNLAILFNILPTHIIVKMFLFSFLEIEILVFSDNLEILNIVLYIFIQLNYPLNVMHYYWQTGSTSLHNYLEGDSLFATKIYTSMQGICSRYNSSINTTKNSHEHFLVDLENKIFIHRYDDKYQRYAKNSEENIALLKYVDNTINTASTIDGKDSQLCIAIKSLYKDLELISKKIIHSNRGVYGYPNFFMNSEAIQQQNKNIQQIFYIYIAKVISILKSSNRFNEIKSNNRSESFQSNNSSYSHSFNASKSNKDDFPFMSQISASTNRYTITYDDSFMASLCYEEKLFINNLENGSKNVLFRDIINKGQLFIDLYQIGNIFFDELTNWSVLDHNKSKFNKSPFEAIDYIYEQEPLQAMTFNSFYNAFKNWRKQLHPQLKQTSIYKSNTKKQFCYNYQGRLFELNYDVLRFYSFFLDNISEEELMIIFPMKKVLDGNSFQEINQVSIQNSITRNLIQQNELEKEDVLYICLLTVFSISLKYDFFPITEKQLCVILSSFHECKVNKQRFVAFILQVIYQRMINKERFKDKKTIFGDINLFDIIMNRLFSNEIIPNDELLHLMNKCYIQKKTIEKHYKTIDKDSLNISIEQYQIPQNNPEADEFELIDKNDKIELSPSENKNITKVQLSNNNTFLKEFNYKITCQNTLKDIKKQKLVSTFKNIMYDGDWSLTKKKQTLITMKYNSQKNILHSKYFSLPKIYRLLTKMMRNDNESNDMIEFRNVLINLLFFITQLENRNEKDLIENFLGKLIYYIEYDEIDYSQDRDTKTITLSIEFIE